jgi:hypothetical protein
MRRSIVALSMSLAIGLGLTGCGVPAENSTIGGLQEENRVLREKIAGLEDRMKSVQAERDARETSLKKEFEESRSRMQQLHQERVSQLEGTVAGLRLELGVVQRERIALQELVDRRPRVEEAHQVREGIAQTILFVFLALSLILLVMVAARYRTLRERMNTFIIQNASSYRVVERS